MENVHRNIKTKCIQHKTPVRIKILMYMDMTIMEPLKSANGGGMNSEFPKSTDKRWGCLLHMARLRYRTRQA